MCCGRRRRNRAPVLVVIGKMAYDKYQERKAEKVQQSQQQNFNQGRSPSPEVLEDQANSEILEKAGISPPSYHDIVNRAEIPEPRVSVSYNEIKNEKGVFEDLVDSTNNLEVGNRLNVSNVDRASVPVVHAQHPEKRGCCGERNGGYASRCERKRAEKMARKAEKYAAKLAKAQAAM